MMSCACCICYAPNRQRLIHDGMSNGTGESPAARPLPHWHSCLQDECSVNMQTNLGTPAQYNHQLPGSRGPLVQSRALMCWLAVPTFPATLGWLRPPALHTCAVHCLQPIQVKCIQMHSKQCHVHHVIEAAVVGEPFIKVFASSSPRHASCLYTRMSISGNL